MANNISLDGNISAAGQETSPILQGTVQIGVSTTDTVGFYGHTGISQPTNGTQAYAVSTYTGLTSTGVGFTVVSQFTNTMAQIAEMRNVLVNAGLMKGS